MTSGTRDPFSGSTKTPHHSPSIGTATRATLPITSPTVAAPASTSFTRAMNRRRSVLSRSSATAARAASAERSRSSAASSCSVTSTTHPIVPVTAPSSSNVT